MITLLMAAMGLIAGGVVALIAQAIAPAYPYEAFLVIGFIVGVITGLFCER